MRSKILFSDLDGTLLDSDKTISEENRKAIIRLLELGHYFVIVTGRPVATGRTVVMELGLTMPGCYMIAFNGAVVYDCAADRILTEKTMPMDIVKDLFDEAQNAGIHVQTYQQNHILTQQHDKELDYYLDNAKMEYKLVNDVFQHMNKEPNKVILIDVEHQDKLIQFKKAHSKLEERCSCFFSRSEYLEYCPKNTNKGTGVTYISEFLNVSLENTVAVGDERNDIPMIQVAGVGAAVKNSHFELLKQADYITAADNNHGAIAEVIEKFFL